MQKYTNTVVDRDGNAIKGANVAVSTYPAGAAATIYSDNGNTVITSSSVTTDDDGNFSFYAPNGRYSVTITAAAFFAARVLSDFVLNDPLNATTPVLAVDGTKLLPGFAFFSDPSCGFVKRNDGVPGILIAPGQAGVTMFGFSNQGNFALINTGGIIWSSASNTDNLNLVTNDTRLLRRTAGCLYVIGSSDATAVEQAYYGKFGGSFTVDYERLRMTATVNGAHVVASEAAGTGVLRDLKVGAGANLWKFSAFGGHFLSPGSWTFGFDVGAGGTVTQATDKSTGVSINGKPTGKITMNAAGLAAGAAVSFTFTANVIEANDQVVVTHCSGGTPAAYNICAFPGAGSASITVRNVTAGLLSEAIVLQYTVIKGAVA